MLKRILPVLFFFLISFPLPAIAGTQEILVFAGAGMRRPLIEVGRRFERTSGVKVIYDFAGSGRLGNKVLVGQWPDIFIPGSAKWA